MSCNMLPNMITHEESISFCRCLGMFVNNIGPFTRFHTLQPTAPPNNLVVYCSGILLGGLGMVWGTFLKNCWAGVGGMLGTFGGGC